VLILDVFNKIEQMLQERGLTMKDLAIGIGVSSGNVSDWKSRKSKPSSKALTRIAEFFGVPLDELVRGNDDLIGLYVTGIRSWASNSFFSESESQRIEEHFQEFLIRYKNYVNCVCDLRTGVTGDVDVSEVSQKSVHEKEALISWLGLLPEYFFNKKKPTTHEGRSATRREALMAETRMELSEIPDSELERTLEVLRALKRK